MSIMTSNVLSTSWLAILSCLVIISRVPITYARDYGCPLGQIRCRSGNQCVSLIDVCRSNGGQCADGSDEDPEICNFWIPDSMDSRCQGEQFVCDYPGHGVFGPSHTCVSLRDFCVSCDSRPKDPSLCEVLQSGMLELRGRHVVQSDDFLILLTRAVNDTSSSSSSSSLSSSPESVSSCPMLYIPVGDQCLAFFSPAKVPWVEARQFCLSIMGELLTINDLISYDKLLQYMKKSELTTDFWIGGRYDLDTNAWSWVTDDSPMTLGSPYWATKYSSSCKPRSPQQGDSSSSSPEQAPIGVLCYHYLQAPATREQGWCAAMTYEHYYYFTDVKCLENRSPLCVFKPHGTSTNSTA